MIKRIHKLLLLFLSLLPSCGGKRGMDKPKNNNQMAKEGFYYEVTCSAPMLAPIEYVNVRYINAGGAFSCFGNEFKEGGMATGYDGVCRNKSSRYRLPRAVEATWVSFTDRKFYRVASLVPYDTILALFRDGGVPCTPISENPLDDEVTEEDKALIRKSLGMKSLLTTEEKRQLNIVFDKEQRWMERMNCFDLCFLPGGKVVLYVKSAVKKVLLDWSARARR